MKWPFKTTYKHQNIEIYGSLVDKKESKIFRLTQNGKEEVTDLNEKYTILQIARSECFDKIVYPKGHHIIVLSYNGKKSIDEYEIDSVVRILDRHIYLLNHKIDKTFSSLCLDLNDNCSYVELGDYYDKDGTILKIFILKKCENKTDKDIGIDLLKKAIEVFVKIDRDFNKKHRPYTDDFIQQLIERKSLFDV